MDESIVSGHMKRLINLLGGYRNTSTTSKYKLHKPTVGQDSCMLCNNANNLKNINTDYVCDEQIENYVQMIMICYNIKLEHSKKDSICDTCVNRLRDAFTFRQQIVEANEQIKNEDKNDSKYDNLNLIVKVDTEILEIEFDDGGNESDKIDDEPNSESTDPDLFGDKAGFTEGPYVILENFQKIPKLDPKLVTCPKCNVTFDNHDSLVKHHNTHYPGFHCDICGRTFLSYGSLRRHMFSHSSKPCMCKYCPKTYLTRSALNTHIRVKHKGLKNYGCHMCVERFFSTKDRKMHLHEVHGIPLRTYLCPKCGMNFTSSSNMTTHLRRVHLNMKDVRCSQCDSTFYTKKSLEIHMLKHTGEKKFECHHCGKCFSRKCTITEHVKSHLNIRAHKCDICGKSFIQKCTLQSHLKTHN